MSEQPPTPEYPAEVYARFLFYAEADLRAAEQVLQSSGGFWHVPCFLARESGEKSLKAFLEAAGKAAPDLHSLRTLCRECVAVDKEFGRFTKHGEILNRYQSEARYPMSLDYPFTQEKATEVVRLARELFEFVRDKIERRKQAGLL
ncbi:MAG: HEPN domain-containing protein [Abditibacteriales bacterium]|nr:HEPN domain-containing protein [Abditibacteriales bacterium]MDW8367750.1 HEPN domain-containing protein [Abditibacteriales bacterium]